MYSNYGVIDGVFYPLPVEAKYIIQESSGAWYWTNKKPRHVIDEETKEIVMWTAKKTPIQYKTTQGFDRVVVTDKPLDFLQTCTSTINTANLPNPAIFR